MNRVKVLGIDLYANDIKSAVALFTDACSGEKLNRCVSATGAHGMVFAKKNPHFKSILDSFYINLPDGMPGVWVGRIKGAGKIRRCYGPDFFREMMKTTSGTSITHYFCGGNSGVADELKNAVFEKFQNKNIVGTFCPPFLPVADYDYDSIAKTINALNVNIVWIGLSTPKQEEFAFNLAKKTNVNFIMTVGAAFDFHTGKVRQSPSLFQKAGLEWFFRLLMEPRRLFKRYVEIVPLFIYYNLKELVIGIVKK
jgi:N-acetylglucosaminyldiphosphoundecaprenol N-acetyl-beta-D-mannosaminyltransferase